MNIKKLLAAHLYVAFFALCAVLLTESALLRLAVRPAPLAVGITAVVAMMITVFFYLNRKNAAVYLGAVAAIALLAWGLHTAGVPAFSFVSNTAAHFFAGRTLPAGEAMLVCAVLSLALSALLFPLLRLRVARYVTAIAATALLVVYGVWELPPDRVETFAAAGLLFAVPTELCLARLYQNRPRRKQNGVLSFLLPVFALCAVAVTLLPASSEPISWKLVTDLANGIANRFHLLSADIGFLFDPESAEFSIGMQGYSDAAQIFGDNDAGSEASQLRLTCVPRPHASIYLIGNVSDTYTGAGWEKSAGEALPQNDFYLDYCETMGAFSRAGLSKEEQSALTARVNLYVTHDEMITKTLFYPLKTFAIRTSGDFDATTPSILFDSRVGSTDEYCLSYLEINYRAAQFQTILRTPFSYTDAPTPSTDDVIDDEILPLLRRRAAAIQTAYTMLPEGVTRRTYDLADEITAHCTNDYEKLCAIESYLRGYTYTLTPGDVPDGADPVDYFLFESSAGYCTYFASAMAVLARCEGIPTRYVQGFAVNCAEHGEITNLPVTGSAAHAWTEAYFEGVGWIPFEPTAAQAQTRYDYRGSIVSSLENEPPADVVYPQYTQPAPTEDPAEQAAGQSDRLVYLLVIFCLLAGIALIGSLYLVVRVRLFLQHYKADTDTGQFLSCYRMTLYLCQKQKLVRETSETAAHFAQRYALTAPDSALAFCAITAAFDAIRYGGHRAEPKQRAQAEAFLRAQFQALAQQRGKPAALVAFVGYCIR